MSENNLSGLNIEISFDDLDEFKNIPELEDYQEEVDNSTYKGKVNSLFSNISQKCSIVGKDTNINMKDPKHYAQFIKLSKLVAKFKINDVAFSLNDSFNDLQNKYNQLRLKLIADINMIDEISVGTEPNKPTDNFFWNKPQGVAGDKGDMGCVVPIGAIGCTGCVGPIGAIGCTGAIGPKSPTISTKLINFEFYPQEHQPSGTLNLHKAFSGDSFPINTSKLQQENNPIEEAAKIYDNVLSATKVMIDNYDDATKNKMKSEFLAVFGNGIDTDYIMNNPQEVMEKLGSMDCYKEYLNDIYKLPGFADLKTMLSVDPSQLLTLKECLKKQMSENYSESSTSDDSDTDTEEYAPLHLTVVTDPEELSKLQRTFQTVDKDAEMKMFDQMVKKFKSLESSNNFDDSSSSSDDDINTEDLLKLQDCFSNESNTSNTSNLDSKIVELLNNPRNLPTNKFTDQLSKLSQKYMNLESLDDSFQIDPRLANAYNRILENAKNPESSSTDDESGPMWQVD